MIHLMDTAADEDSFLAIADHVSNLLNDGQAKTALADTPGSVFLTEVATLIQEQRWEQYVTKMLGQLDLVFSKATDKEAECVANVLVHATARVPADRVRAVAQQFASVLTSKVDERSEERLGALLNLYGALHEHCAAQRQVFLTATEYARKGPRLAAMLVPAVRGRSEDLLEAWGQTADEAASRELLMALASLVKIGTDARSVKEYWRLVNTALTMCKEGDAAAATQLRPLALAAVTDFVRSQTGFQADFSASPAVQALANDSATKALHGLFSAVLSGDMAAFRAAATPAALEAAGTSLEAATTKARLVALLALCSKSSHEEVPFSAIQKALDVADGQVEGWVVRAIGAKLIEAKIDQVRSVVVVSRCTQRTFGSGEWKTLQGQVHAWRDALQGARATVGAQAAKLAGTAAAAGAAGTRGPSAVRA